MAKTNKSLLSAIEKIAESEGFLDEAKEQIKDNDEKRKEMQDEQGKATSDGVMTSNTNNGAELERETLFTDEMYSQVVDESSLLNLLPGNHGQINASSQEVTIKGKPKLFKKGSESGGSDGNGTNVEGSDSIGTDKVEVGIKKYETQIEISREMMQTAVLQGSLVDYVRQQVVEGAKETINASIINADKETNLSSPGNVNLKEAGTNPDSLDTTKYYLTQDNGLRKLGIANGVVAPAAISKTQYQKMLLGLGEYADDFQNLLWIASPDAGIRARGVDGYTTIDKFGTNASNVRGGIFERIEGIDVFKTRHLSNSVSDEGYIESGDSAANDNSQLMLLYKPAVQYAFGHDMVIHPIVRAGKIVLDVAMWFGFGVANETAGLDKTISTGLITKA